MTDPARAFGARWGEPAEVVSLVRDGMHVAGGLIEPTDLLAALAKTETRGEATLALAPSLRSMPIPELL